MSVNYQELKRRHPEMVECFFAFSKEQLEEGKRKAGLEDKKIYSADFNLFGTKEGIEAFFSFYDRMSKEISEKCNPQEVYNDEYINHECDYVGDDEEAIKIAISYFGKDKAKKIKRKYGYLSIDEIVCE